MLQKTKKTRGSWFSSKKGEIALDAAGLTAGTAAATISLAFSPTPLMPVAVVTGVLGLIGSGAILGLKLLREWKAGKKEANENGLHYLMKI